MSDPFLTLQSMSKHTPQIRSRRGRGATLVRVLTLLRTLEARRSGLTIAEAVDLLNTSRRTVYRDLAALEEAGYPLTSCRCSDGDVRWSLVGRR